MTTLRYCKMTSWWGTVPTVDQTFENCPRTASSFFKWQFNAQAACRPSIALVPVCGRRWVRLWIGVDVRIHSCHSRCRWKIWFVASGIMENFLTREAWVTVRMCHITYELLENKKVLNRKKKLRVANNNTEQSVRQRTIEWPIEPRPTAIADMRLV